MKPGIYDISNDEYHSSAGISRSGIMEFRRSPLHFWDKYLNEDYEREEQTPALIFGNAFHTYILEPDEFFNRYAVKPESAQRIEKLPLLKDVGREAYDLAKKNIELAKQKREQAEEEFLNLSYGKEILDTKDLKKIIDMAAAVKRNPETNSVITGAEYEKSIYWKDKESGLLVKARPDILHQTLVGDLKTAADASEREFQYAIQKYGYHIQAAMIQDGIYETQGKFIEHFAYAPVEKTKPYANTVYFLDERSIEKGRELYKKALMGIKNCFETNIWPGYEMKRISLPTWAFSI